MSYNPKEMGKLSKMPVDQDFLVRSRELLERAHLIGQASAERLSNMLGENAPSGQKDPERTDRS